MRNIHRNRKFAAPVLALACLGLGACSQVESKDDAKQAAVQEAKAASAKLDKPYPINEQKEVIAQIDPQLLALMAADLRSQGKPEAAANLEKLYDAKSGKILDTPKLPEIQNQLDLLGKNANLGNAGGAQ